jgi:predicted HicB family RNase H-like nuclease
MMNYKGYHGTVSFDEEAEIFHGEVTDLRDVVIFQGRSVDEIKTAFRESVDDYLEFCAERGGKAGQTLLRKIRPPHRPATPPQARRAE